MRLSAFFLGLFVLLHSVMASFSSSTECKYCCNHVSSTDDALRSHEKRHHVAAIAASHYKYDRRYKEKTEGMLETQPRNTIARGTTIRK